MAGIVVIALLVIFSLTYPVLSQTEEDLAMLKAGEGFFLVLKNREYGKIWGFLSQGSKERIVKDVVKAISERGETSNEESIRKDFENLGPVSFAYWSTFAQHFDPDLVLLESTWKLGKRKEREGEIILTHRQGRRPAVLRMFKENGEWKVGLVESFWTRKK
jgi:hypothetical protein